MNDQGYILAVDDTTESLLLLNGILTPAGFQVRSADSGELALAAVAAQPPDLILLDVCMEGMDGFEVCRRLQAGEETRNIPIILISAFADTKDWVKGLNLGAVDYITKPFQAEELLTRVKTHLSLGRVKVSLQQQAAALQKANEQLQDEIAKRLHVEEELRQNLHQAERSRRAVLSALEDQKRAEQAREQMLQALREREESYKALVAGLPDTFKRFDSEGRHLFVSSNINKEGDLPAEAIIGKTHRELDFPEAQCRFWEEALQEVFTSGKPVEAEVAFQGQRGPMILNQRLIPEFDANGKVRSVLSVSRDISEHRRLAQEKEKLQGQLNQALKMESIGRLAGGVAHDFNNMLMVILGHSELALKQVLSSDPLAANLKEIRKAAQKSTDLTRQLLAFARKQTIAPRVLNLNETVASVLKMLGRLIREDIDLVWQPGANVWPVKMDPSQVDQILANLCVNARDAIAEVGKIIIETSTTTFDEAFCAKHPGSVPGDFVLLTVSDNGCGMDRAILDRLFEPYFTTKEMGKGTGLGLATVYGIVKQNNGFIEVDSTPGQGSTFRTYLPRHLEEAEPMPPKRPAAPTRHSWETLLVVEDEPGILKMSKMIFEGQGYTVLTAATPAEALRLAKKHRGSIHLLLTDVVMPEMNGRDLAKILMSQNPTLKCLFMSGYTADVIAHRGVLDEGIHFIQKPMPIKELVAKVREVLDLSGKIGMNLDG